LALRLSTPEQITHLALSGTNAQALETLKLFSTYLGRVAGDLAMVFLAKGGVFLAGGISQKILPVLMMPDFRSAFEDKAPHSEIMREISTSVLTHPRAALAGLANYAIRPDDFALQEGGRRWSSTPSSSAMASGPQLLTSARSQTQTFMESKVTG